MDSEESMVPVYRAPNAADCALIIQWLDKQGISARAVGGQASGGFGELGTESLTVEVWAAPDRADEARTEIERFYAASKAERPDSGPWTCSGCNEQNDTDFDVCWSCQTARP